VFTPFIFPRSKVTILGLWGDGTHNDHLMMKKYEAIAPDLSERIMNEGDGFAGVTLAQRLERLLPTGAQFFVDG
jgi:hypothetical protein